MTPRRNYTPQEAALAALLDWYGAIGVDATLDETPHDRFAESARSPAPMAPEPPASEPVRPELEPTQPEPTRSRKALLFPSEAARAAEDAASGARTLDELSRSFEAFEGCGYKTMARHFLFSAGSPGAALMTLDLAPDAEEELTGKAFGERKGRLLAAMMAAVGIGEAYHAYLSPWRPAGDLAAPPPHELGALSPFARRHVELARPTTLIIFGEALARGLCGIEGGAAELYGRSFDCAFGAHRAHVAVAPRLSLMLTQPVLKRTAWNVLRRLQRDGLLTP